MEIVIEDQKYNIVVQEDHTYKVTFNTDEFILCPKLTETNVLWSIEKGTITPELAQKIGAKIKRYEE